MAVTAFVMKSNLQQARRSSRVQLNQTMKEDIKRQLKQGTSKKLLCVLYGLSYEDLKTI
ncbi:hypothetical protein [Vibrio phage vB_VhaP_PG11]|nr:hypothetical protein [Vibrio phage vB_VhaP_PG11]